MAKVNIRKNSDKKNGSSNGNGHHLKAMMAQTNPRHTIPSDAPEGEGREVDLSLLEGWDHLSKLQQQFLVAYSQNDCGETWAMMRSGIKKSTYDNWRSGEIFTAVMEQVDALHVELVESVDYKTALNGVKGQASRGRFLENRSKRYGKEPSNQLPPARYQQNNIYLTEETAQQKGLAALKEVMENRQDSQSEAEAPNQLTDGEVSYEHQSDEENAED